MRVQLNRSGLGVLVYRREKTKTQASIKIGERLRSILNHLPAEGLLFPKIATLDSVARAVEFYRRCHILGTLHSYRYAWAERAFSIGYPERFAQAALGHESRAVHLAYRSQSQGVLPGAG